MFPKSSKENDSIDELKREIQLNDEAMEKQRKIAVPFDAAFIKGTNDNTGFLELVHPQGGRQTSPWVNPAYKNWVLFAFASVAFIVLLVLILADGTGRHYVEEWPAIQSAGFHSSNQVLNTSANRNEALVQETTTTTTTTTEAPPTTQKLLHYLLASVIVNNATVPQMDKTLLHQFSRADPYCILYVINGITHRKVGQTGVDKNTMAPRWNYLFEHQMKVYPDTLLNFEIWDFDNLNQDEMVGKLFVKMDTLLEDDLNGRIVKRSYGKGWLWFTVHWKEVYKYV